DDASVCAGRDLLASWDKVLSKDSPAAALYEVWLPKLEANVAKLVIPTEAAAVMRGVSLTKMIRTLNDMDAKVFGPDPRAKTDDVLTKSLADALADLRTRLGPDMEKWR